MRNSHKIYAVPSDDITMYAVIPDDGTRGYLMGEIWEVEQLRDKLNALLDRCEHDGEVDGYNEQLGRKWLSVTEAVSLIHEVRSETISGRTIRYACKHGFIKRAELQGRDWRLSPHSLMAWVNNRPKPGRK